MKQLDKIESLYGWVFPRDLNKFKEMVEASNSLEQLINSTGISKNYIRFLLERYELSIVPKCLYCGKPLPRATTGAVKKYCNSSCRYHHQEKPTIICSVCGKEFKGTSGAKYCSKECKSSHKKVCKWCGKVYLGTNKSLYCSSKCVSASKNHQAKVKTMENLNMSMEERADLILLNVFGTTNEIEIRNILAKGFDKND